MEDDIVSNLVVNELEEYQNATFGEVFCPKKLQVRITGNPTLYLLFVGFLEDKAPIFMQELWDLLLSAEKEESGIPPGLIMEKHLEKQKKME